LCEAAASSIADLAAWLIMGYDSAEDKSGRPVDCGFMDLAGYTLYAVVGV
jgi:hypothetical protein